MPDAELDAFGWSSLNGRCEPVARTIVRLGRSHVARERLWTVLRRRHGSSEMLRAVAAVAKGGRALSENVVRGSG